jgi:PiT family inorganic phosphate transporter
VQITSQIIICALLGAIVWNLITWYLGLPSSSSHALIGGLCGTALAASHNQWAALIWSQPDHPFWKGKGLLWKVVVPMFGSPVLGFIAGFVLMSLLFALIVGLSNLGGIWARAVRTRWVNAFFSKAQLFSAGYMGFAHGSNDAQKTMGIIALALVAATSAGTLDHVPSWLEFLRLHSEAGKDMNIPVWIKLVCAVVMASGTAVGGWRIIKTLGHKMVKLDPINGFAAETSGASVILAASLFGIPVSTTHNISAAIMGVGAAKRFSAVKWTVVERMIWAWLLTIPAAGGIAWCLVKLLQTLGWA